MVEALVTGSSSPVSSLGQGHCVVFLNKTLYTYRATLHPGVQMGTGEFNAGGNGVASHLGGVKIVLVVVSCYRNCDQ